MRQCNASWRNLVSITAPNLTVTLKFSILIALSQTLGEINSSQLEIKVGAQLFFRSKKGCTPTSAGELFRRQAEQLLENWNHLSKSIRQDQEALTGKFRVGCHPSLGVYALPAFLKSLAKKAPEIEIVLAHDFSRNLSEKIISYELDLALVVNPVKQNDLVLNKIFEDRICLWKSKTNEAPSRQIFTDMNRTEVRAFFGKKYAHFENWKVTESTSLELVRALVIEGVGIGILPERVAKAGKVHLELYDKTLPTPRDEIYVIHRSDTLKSQAGRVLRDIARTCFGSS